MRLRGFALIVAAVSCSGAAQAEIAGDKVRIGVLTDLSGIYEAGTGNGSLEAAKMAVEEFGGKVNGKPIEILAGDHQNKPDLGAAIANRWFDVDKIDAVAEVVNSAVAFAVLEIAKKKNKTILLTGAGSADFTGKACAPDNSVHWVYDTYQTGAAIGAAVPQLGKKWFMLSADYAFGAAMESSVRRVLDAQGASVVGGLKHPLGTTDFSSYVLQAKAANPDVIALNNAGDDLNNAIKAAREFGLKAKLVAFGDGTPSMIKAIGLESGQGIWYINSWVSRDDAETKTWVDKFMARRKVPPGSFQVGTYSAVRSYVKAVEATNTTDPKVVIAKMRETPVRDVFTQDGYLRPDGRMVHSVALVQIKTPAESKGGEWDLTKVVGTLAGDKVFRPLADGGCPALAGK